MAITGRAVLLLLLGVVAVLLRPVPTTVGLWTLLVGAVAALDLALAPSPRRLQIEPQPVDPVRAGEPTAAPLLVTNTGTRRVRGVLRDAWQPSAGAGSVTNRHRLDLPGGERVRLVTPLLPVRRGERSADQITVRSLGPLRVAARQLSFDAPRSVRVLPAFPSRRHLPSRLARLRQIDGNAAVRIRGQGTEFDSLRDYVEGDDVRSIDWRATARRQSVVVRTWRPERDRRLLLVLDTSRLSAGRVGDTPRLDSAMDATLLLASLASRAGDHVSFLAGDRVVQAAVSGATRTDLLPRLSDAMTHLEPALVEADWTALGAAIARDGKRQSLVVLLTPLEPAAVEETLLPVLASLAARHRVVVASVSDQALDELAAGRSTVGEVYDSAAAERSRTLRRRTAHALSGLGVHVIDEPPERLPVALADHYLMLKSRGLL